MSISLDELIAEHQEVLVDKVTKDAICRIPSYREAPLRETIQRVERWLKALSDSIAENDPEILEEYLQTVARERRKQGYAIAELHAIVQITEEHMETLVNRALAVETERNANLAVLEIVMDAARMVLSVTYVINAQANAAGG
jgi:ribosome-binding protein aMBF1 (putative translation factor)